MCLVLLPDLYQSLSPRSNDSGGGGRGLQSSLLLTLARMPDLGEFLPHMQMQPKKGASAAGRERQQQEVHVTEDVKVLIKGVLLELQGLARKDEDTLSRQAMRDK